MCNSGPGGVGWHNADGSPNLNKTKFPDLPGAVDYAHSLNLSVAWYLNNCQCADHNSDAKFFAGDAKFVLDHKMEGVKIDGELAPPPPPPPPLSPSPPPPPPPPPPHHL